MSDPKQRCGTCRYFLDSNTHIEIGKQGQGACRCNPLQTLAIQTPQGVVINSFFPQMLEDGWCGKWEFGIIKQQVKIVR